MKHLLLLPIMFFSATGCVSLLPEPKVPDALYRLGPVDPDASIVLERSLVVRQPEAPRILSGVDIASRDNRGAVRLVDGVEWADRAPRLFQLTLLDYLGTDGNQLALLPETGARADFELTWRISELALEGDTAIARVQVTVLDGQTRKPLWQKMVSSRLAASSSTSAGRAEALAEAGRDVVRQTAVFIADVTAE